MSDHADVFVCFPRRADAAAAAWIDKLLATLAEMVNPPVFGNEMGPPISFWPDIAVGSVSAAPADPARAASSAVLVVLLSPALAEDKLRLEEIRRFREQAEADGRSVLQTVIATIEPFQAGTGAELAWLMEDGRRAANADGFWDAQQKQRIEGDLGQSPQGFVQLLPPIQSLAGEIRGRVKEMRRRRGIDPWQFGDEKVGDRAPIEQRTPPPQPLAPAPAPGGKRQVYLQSAADPAIWAQTQNALGTHYVVNPGNMAPTDFDLAALKTRDETRRQFLLRCKGLVLLRSRADDQVDLQVSTALDDFSCLRQVASFRDPPWVLVDWIPDAGPLLPVSSGQLPRISAAPGVDWAGAVQQALG
jgi:hypothetical protein